MEKSQVVKSLIHKTKEFEKYLLDKGDSLKARIMIDSHLKKLTLITNDVDWTQRPIRR